MNTNEEDGVEVVIKALYDLNDGMKNGWRESNLLDVRAVLPIQSYWTDWIRSDAKHGSYGFDRGIDEQATEE